MTTKLSDPLVENNLQDYIAAAVKAAGYEGFGMSGCDLTKPIWWAAYCRQSLDQQSKNNRLPEYLLALARMAKAQGVIVPVEYILYDHSTGEHLERPDMVYLRHELVHKKRILGIMFADLRCLSREPAPQQVFERECEILGIKLLFGDAPSGMDIGSQFARSAITFSNKMSRLATDRNARAGNVGRVLKGWVPSQKAPYGYVYKRDAEITDGRIRIKKAWWEIDSLDQEGKVVQGSPADAIVKVFQWIGNEGCTAFKAARKLNELGIPRPSGGTWTSNSLCHILLNHCYTGKHHYNANCRVPNPSKPLGDVTGAVRRTLVRPKASGEAVEYSIPPLVSEELWTRANNAVRERGRGRGKEGKVIESLLRSHIFCPRCGKPLVLKRIRHSDDFYYLCSRLYHDTKNGHCTYRRFIPCSWDNSVWDCVYALLKQEGWIEDRLQGANNHGLDVEKLVKLEQQKITLSQTKIGKVREGYEGGLYNLEDAKSKVNHHQGTMDKAQKEIERLLALNGKSAKVNVEELKKELERLSQENLDKATFTEKRDIINKLGIRVYPSEDLKSMKIRSTLNLRGNGHSQKECVILELGSLRSQ